jgi:hypothetical protein
MMNQQTDAAASALDTLDALLACDQAAAQAQGRSWAGSKMGPNRHGRWGDGKMRKSGRVSRRRPGCGFLPHSRLR